MMRYIQFSVFFLLLACHLPAQEVVWLEGNISFLSSRNVYVKFTDTKQIEVGDSLYVKEGENYISAVIVENKSSTSTVCTPIIDTTFDKGTALYAKTIRLKTEKKKEKKEEKFEKEAPVEDNRAPNLVVVPEEEEENLFKEKISARVSAASYSNFSDYKELHRMRYAFLYRGKNIKNSRFSTDNYITFRHTFGEWEEVENDLARALKVYAFSINYDFDSTSHITLGRKINPRTSSLGAIDGLQYEKGLGRFIVGGIAGSRPDYSNYSFNPNLLQLGAYASLQAKNPSQSQQTTLGVIEQRNQGNTDRRFVYFQHSSNPLKHLNLYSSFEVDLFENINNEAHSMLRLTNLYVSLRYRLNRKWRFSTSYDTRRNIIYYESYKSFIDRLIDQETRQGLRFGINYRPFKLATLGINTSWRFQKSDLNLSRNLNAYFNFSRIPKINTRLSLSANFLETNFLTSKIFGLRLSKDIIPRRLDMNIYYRMVKYKYKSNESQVNQDIAGTSLSLRILKQLTLHLYYEGTLVDDVLKYQRFNTKLIQRF